MENQKNNKIVITLLIIIIAILSVLCVLFATGTISFKPNDVGNNETNSNVNDKVEEGQNGNNDLDDNGNKENELIEEIKDIFKFAYDYYVPAYVYCGKSEVTNKMPENGNGLPYVVSLDFTSYNEMLSYLKKYMSEEVISNKYAFESTNKNWYYESDGKLFCEQTGKGNMYGINNVDIEITSQNTEKIVCVASVELINESDTNDAKKYEKVNVTLEKNNDNWIITSYEEQK